MRTLLANLLRSGSRFHLQVEVVKGAAIVGARLIDIDEVGLALTTAVYRADKPICMPWTAIDRLYLTIEEDRR